MDVHSVIAEALEGMTDLERTVFARRADGFGFVEVSRQLEVSRSTVRQAHNRAELKVFQALKPLLYEALKGAS